MLYQKRQPGIQVIVNENTNRALISYGKDTLATLRQKLAAIDARMKNNQYYVGTLPDLLEEEIRNEKRNVADVIYMFIFDEGMIADIAELQYQRQIKTVARAIKVYIRTALFKDYGIYGSEDPYKHDRHLLHQYNDKITEMFKKGAITIYKSVDNKYEIMKEFNDAVEINYEELLYNKKVQINNDTIFITDNNTVKFNIDNKAIKLLKIESKLRDVSINELINSLISDKAKDIYKVIVE